MADVPIERQIEAMKHEIKHIEYMCPDIGDHGHIAALRAALETLEATQWRLIDTAPKDGTKVLAFHRVGMITIAHYGRSGDFNPLGWISQGGINHIDQPTYWMPLPPPPGERDV